MQTLPVVLMNRASTAVTNCICDISSPREIDFQTFRSQEERLAEALKGNNIPVMQLDAATEGYPDGCFVKDTIKPIGSTLFVGSPRHAARRREIGPVEQAALRSFSFSRVVRMAEELGPEDSIEFGDAVCVNGKVFFGISTRTTSRAVQTFSGLTGKKTKVIPVEIDGKSALHLDMVANPISHRAVFGDFNRCDPRPFTDQGLETIQTPEGEEDAGCLLYINSPDREVIVIPDCFPRSVELIAEHNPRAVIIPVPFDEIFKADAGPNCLTSLLYVKA